MSGFRAAIGAMALILAPLGAGGAAAVAQTVPALAGRVVDKAGILSAEQEDALAEKSEALEARTGHQFVIVTLASLDGRTIEEVSLALANGWGIGRKVDDDGVLLIVAPNERKVRIAVGPGLVQAISDGAAATIVQEVILPEFREDRLPEGISKGADAIIARLSEPDE